MPVDQGMSLNELDSSSKLQFLLQKQMLEMHCLQKSISQALSADTVPDQLTSYLSCSLTFPFTIATSNLIPR